MKKVFLTLVILSACAGVFAQGKVNLINDAGSLVTLDSSLYYPQDAPLAGQPIGNSSPLPSGVVLRAGLYGGTSQNNLFLYSTLLLNGSAPGSAGVIGPLHIVLNALPNGAPAIPGIANNIPIGASTPWFQVRVWDSAFSTYDAAVFGGLYFGYGAEFQMNPGPSIGYVNTSPSANSTWTDGPIVVPIPNIPEPSSFVLAALGAAVMLIVRRRK